MEKVLTFLLAFLFLFLVETSRVGSADELQDGLFSYRAGEYNTAYELLSPIAMQGNPVAQVLLGIMFEKGQGVTKNYKEAAKWQQLSAQGGNAVAQNRLGQIFAEALHRRDKEVSNEALEKERRRPLRAPLIITVCAKIDLERVDKIPIVEQVVSAGTACQNILLAAHERGYGAMMFTGANAHDPYVL